VLRRLRIENLVLIREAELELDSGLNVFTGETGAGKTIFSQAIGLLLGAAGDAALVGPSGGEAYVEAELEAPPDFFDEPELAALADLRPEGEEAFVVARRVFGDGRTRAYAWGRSVAREDVAAAVERLVAMSGQFEQRRLTRPAFQLEVLDRFAGAEQLALRRELAAGWRDLVRARRRVEEVERDASSAGAERDELESLVAATADFTPGEEEQLRGERERLLHVVELGAGAETAAAALEPDDGAGAASLAAGAAQALTPVERLAPELAAHADELRELTIRLREVAGDLRRFAGTLEAEPGRLDQVEERLERIATARRRFGARTFDELVDARDRAAERLAGLDAAGGDPLAAAREAMERAEREVEELAVRVAAGRRAAAPRLAAEVSHELAGLGLDGDLRVDLGSKPTGPSGADDVALLVRPNAGLPYVPVADAASGGELSRIALALAAVAGGETMVFDEIDAGVGGVTAHRVADTLTRLAAHAQVLAITHLPQVASVAAAHFRIEKVAGDPTHTRIDRLEPVEQAGELERMLGGQEFIAAVSGRRPS
jgi:DNA repair protein RecN (Recombination protein N)